MLYQEFAKYIRSVRAASADLAKMDNKFCGVLYLNTQKLRNDLLPQLQTIMGTIRLKLIEVAKVWQICFRQNPPNPVYRASATELVLHAGECDALGQSTKS